MNDLAHGDAEYDMVYNIASHPNVSPQTLDNMVEFNESLVKQNPGVSVSDTRLMTTIAKNPNTSTSTLKKLSKYEGEVGKAATDAIKSRTFDLSKLSPEMREKIKDWDM